MTMPQIPPAGITSNLAETAKDALTWDPTRPQTPGDIKKYRQSTLHEPGAIVRHPGQAEDPVPQGPFGVKSAAAGGQSVLEALVNYPESELARWKIERAEEIYARCATRPCWRPGRYMVPCTGATARSPVGLVCTAWHLVHAPMAEVGRPPHEQECPSNLEPCVCFGGPSHSAQREPLGRGYVRGHKIPDGLGTQRPFGVTYDAMVSA